MLFILYSNIMTMIQTCALPGDALLQKYAGSGAFTDCHFIDVPGHVSQESYVTAFYCSAVFRPERTLIGWLLRRPATDSDAARLGAGEAARFSAWEVEARAPGQILLRAGNTRSWLMSAASEADGQARTRLYFGSAVLPRRRTSPTEEPSFGFLFHALSGFHRVYSRALLGSARSRLGR